MSSIDKSTCKLRITKGPTGNSNWLLHISNGGGLIVGGYPRPIEDLDKVGVKTYVTLMEHGEKGYSDYNEYHEVYRMPIKDRHSTTDDNLSRTAKYITYRIKKGDLVYLHCLGGHGRTGLVAGAVLREFGYSYEDTAMILKEGHHTRDYKPNMRTPQSRVQWSQLKYYTP
jgi:protein-tyrosine phosphatase